MTLAPWWESWLGGTDDSLLLLDYFEKRTPGAVSLAEVLVELHLLTPLQHGSWARADAWFALPGMPEAHFGLAVEVVIDLSAVVVECIHSGVVPVAAFGPAGESDGVIDIDLAASAPELVLLQSALGSFLAEPGRFEISEFLDGDELQELTSHCTQIVAELQAYLSAAPAT
ncbi:hypothetical protein GCM10022381_12390 [Leifsonia kafniensis]|uniref:Uncharacterized protein n=1 Tax=Leifsonia kafniensis TaxID=475957 RepID=A0ABP7KA47_9MICO